MLEKYKILFFKILAVIAIFFLVDTYFSILVCHYEQYQYPNNKNCAEHCAVLNGPFVFYTALIFNWIGSHMEAISAAISAIATVAIARFTWTLWQAGEKQLAISSNLADIADKQVAIQGLQTDIQKMQHAVGRLQFIADHRPRLRIRHVTIDLDGNTLDKPRLVLHSGEKVTGSLVVVNFGGSNASISDSRYRIIFSQKRFPVAFDFDENALEMLVVNTILESGESCAVAIEDSVPAGSEYIDLRHFDINEWNIYVMGQIKYKDAGGNERFMGFCRKSGSDGKFTPVDDADYEYQD